ncbi:MULTISPECIES: D-alanyl-D-alanine carboxypeptidase family protein [Lysinibacillus]|jgi:D-alanyl-D-alanine carboxypeptidase (penicillin-binding protein 5/6)|uniref:D-alanyl-D-alanine carboxypeptidase n=1 Tax=Lysinibacillus fusiformis TaxID=28031 RepID=A0A2I0V3S9_9BACI|nr:MULTISPECIES: serine hydrolase [Lysinibacillus]KUF36788.1 D-alanyl-D-alanine carboxypeptidase [Lysinibacillus sp. F5]MEE3807354.1 serine hydrolase [Lysinibacillus fusiformis]PKU52967.1 D-alanyl-D-alanine carboxypeptidase [Lysinibacillus fusiformis]WCH49079.1 serine hydrolase [Lysinibacillus sp. OF-1]SCX96773.1 D-alanyl-D-alanine carboxypeptidase (penicillin-binding protein 5/6) [Lysinibacillus sp. SG9]
MFTRKGIVSILFLFMIVFVYLILKETPVTLRQEMVDSPKVISTMSSDMLNIDLYSSNAILVNLDENQVLLDKNSEEVIYPASLTKMMTVLVAIEQIPSLQDEIVLPKNIFNDLYEENASVAGFLPNERLTIEDLLYGSMLPSGAEASIGLAEYAAGSERKFVKLMNDKAQQLGMKNTHFMNTTGLHHPDHYTTVKDMSLLLQYALTNDEFRNVYTAERYSIKSTNLHPEGITFTNRMFQHMTSSVLPGGKILGGKTGYTEDAGLCLASLATVNGQEYVLVTVGAEGGPRTEQYNITDAFSVYSQL